MVWCLMIWCWWYVITFSETHFLNGREPLAAGKSYIYIHMSCQNSGHLPKLSLSVDHWTWIMCTRWCPPVMWTLVFNPIKYRYVYHKLKWNWSYVNPTGTRFRTGASPDRNHRSAATDRPRAGFRVQEHLPDLAFVSILSTDNGHFR